MKVRKRKYPSGSIRWELDLGKIAGKRVQKFYRTKQLAENALSAARGRLERHGSSAMELGAGTVARYAAAERRLVAAKSTIEEAVEYFLVSKARIKEEITLGDLVTRALLAKEAADNRTRYVNLLRCSWRAFSFGRSDRLAASITKEEVRAWIQGNGWARKTKQNNLGDLRTLFSWALAPENGFVSENPAKQRLNFGRRTEHEIESFPVPKVRALLDCAVRVPVAGQEDHRDFVWYLALGFFAGLRPDEMGRLDRSAVNLEERHVVIGGAESKTRTRRVVDLSENCVAWLHAGPDDAADDPVRPSNFRKKWRRLREDAGILNRTPRQGERPGRMPAPDPALRWIHDGMRHTYASYHYALHQAAALLKAQMGHSEREDTLMRHYRGVRTRKEAVEFWGMLPAL